MNSTTVVIVAAAGFGLTLLFLLIRISQMTRVSVPDHPLWPPTYFYPDRRRQGALTSDAPPTGEIRVANMRPHSGIPVTDATNMNVPPNWRENAERGTDATMAEFLIPNASQLPRHSGIPVNDATNPNARVPMPGSEDVTQISQTTKPNKVDAWFGDLSTSKNRADEVKRGTDSSNTNDEDKDSPFARPRQ